MYKNKMDIDVKIRQKVIGILQSRLADSIDLLTQCKQAHWNVKGPEFIALHKLFDSVFEHSVEWMDLIGERIVQLGGRADGIVSIVAKNTTLPEYPLEIVDGMDHVENLSNSLSQFAASIRQCIDLVADLKDATTADVLTEVSRGVDMDLWFVEAHAQGRGQEVQQVQENRATEGDQSLLKSRSFKKADRAHSSTRAD